MELVRETRDTCITNENTYLLELVTSEDISMLGAVVQANLMNAMRMHRRGDSHYQITDTAVVDRVIAERCRSAADQWKGGDESS